MSRILLTCWGSYGDLFPTLGIATALAARGHTPVVATCAYYRGLVENEGFEFRPVRPDVDPADNALIRRIMDPDRGTQVILQEILAPAVRDSYADLLAAARGADLIVSHPVSFAAPLVAEKLGLRWVSTVLAPISFFSSRDFPLLPNAPRFTRQLRRLGPWSARLMMRIARRMTSPWIEPVLALRRELALPPRGDPLYEGQFSPYGTLALFSSALAQAQPDWPAGTQITGFPFFNRAIPMPEALNAFLEAGEPPVVFTLGSSAVGAAGSFYEVSLKAATALRRRAVLLIGRNPENRPRAVLPQSVIALESAPHDQLFSRSAAIVHQGGIGTTGETLRSGRPALIVPHAHDQPDNAFRVMKTGAARILYPRQYSVASAIPALRALLEDSRHARSARAVARSIAVEDGARSCADFIERLASGRG